MGKGFKYDGKFLGVLKFSGVKKPCLCIKRGTTTEVLATFVNDETADEFFEEVKDMLSEFYIFMKDEEEKMTLFEKYNENNRFDYEAVIENVCIKDCECLKGRYDVEASESICRKSDIAEETCKKCWNLNYIEDSATNTNDSSKNIRVGTKWRDKKTEEVITIICLGENNVWFESRNSTEISTGSIARENFIKNYEYIKDNVNHPEHYQGKHECIEVMRVLFGDEAVKGFCKCNAYKYRFRAGKKEENTADQDILKAEFYEDYLIKMQEGLI